MKTRTLLPVPVEDEIENFFDAYGVLHELVNVVEFVAAGSSGAGVVIGNYGFGKTHVLLHLSSHVRRRYVKSFSIYVDTPGVSVLNFYNAVMGALFEDGELVELVASRVEEPLGRLLRIAGSDTEDSKYIKLWLLGDAVPQNVKSKFGLISTRISEELAVKYLVKIVWGLARAGRVPLVFLFDELEDVIAIPQPKRLHYLRHLRMFIDSLPGGAFFLASTTPAGWDGILNTYPPLARRLSSLMIHLRPFTLEETEKFVEFLLERRGARASVDREVVKAIYDISEGNPGEVVKLLNILLLNGALDSTKKAKEVLSRYV
jgi:type II secretory pathway predicted ATPase ExeA